MYMERERERERDIDTNINMQIVLLFVVFVFCDNCKDKLSKGWLTEAANAACIQAASKCKSST
jgi:hypothetical protein